MKIHAINEKIESENNGKSDLQINNVPAIRRKYSSLLTLINTNMSENYSNDFIKILETINSELLIHNPSTSDWKILNRLKVGCLKLYSRFSSGRDKWLYLQEALEIDSSDISTWFEFGVALYEDQYIYNSLAAFEKVISLNWFHALAYKYLVLINTFFCNYKSIFKHIEHLISVAKNRKLSSELLYSIENVSLFHFQKELNTLKILHKIDYQHLSNDNNTIHWFLTEYDKWRDWKFPCKFPATPSSIQVSLNHQNHLNFIQFSKVVFELMSSQLNIKNLPMIFKNPTTNDSKSRQIYENINSESKNINNSDIIDNLCQIAKKIKIDCSYKSTENTSEEEIKKNFKISDSYFHEDFIKILYDKISVYRLDRFLVDILFIMSSDTPTEKWTLDMCSFFSHIFVNIQGKYLTQTNFSHHNELVTFLRFIEIYKVIINETDFNENESFVVYKYTLLICVKKIKEYLLEFPLSAVSNILASRILFSLGLTAHDSKSAITYFTSCLKYLDESVILLFSENCSSILKTISSVQVLKLITRCNYSYVIKNTNKLFKKRKYDDIYIKYREIFKENLCDLICLKDNALLKYIKILLKSFNNLLDFTIQIVDDVFTVLEFTLDTIISVKIGKPRSLINLIINSIDKLSKYIVDFELSVIDKIYYLIIKLIDVINLFETPCHCIKIWEILSMIIFYRSSNLENEDKVCVIFEFFLIFHSCFVLNKICCLDLTKKIFQNILSNLICVTNQKDLDLSISFEISNLIDAIFYCCIDYPPFKRLSSSLNYIKDHQIQSNRVMSVKNLPNLNLAFNYYKPSFEPSYILMTESFESFKKRPTMNNELLRFFISIGQFIGDKITDSSLTNLNQLSKIIHDSLLGIKPWPIQYLKVTKGFNDRFSHVFDFSIFHFLSDHYIRTQNYNSALNWVLLAIVTLPNSYLSWWGCASFLYFKIYEESLVIECNSNQISLNFFKLLQSFTFCFKQTFSLIPEGFDNFKIVINDFAWICYNMVIFFKSGFQVPPNKKFGYNFLTLSNKSLSYLLNDSSLSSNYNIWTYGLELNNFIDILGKNKSDMFSFAVSGINSLKMSLNDKNNIQAMSILIFELSIMLWKGFESHKTEITEIIENFVAFLGTFYMNKHKNQNITKAHIPVIDQSPVCSQPNNDVLSQEYFPQNFVSGLTFPTNDLMFSHDPYQKISLIGMFACLSVFPYYIKFLSVTVECLYELSKRHEGFSLSFHKLIVDFICGKVASQTLSSSSNLSTMFSLLEKKLYGQTFVGIFNLASRSNLFRKTFKLNSIFFDGICLFQHYVYRTLKILIDILIEQSLTSLLVHVHTNLARERNNTFVLEPKRIELLNICKKTTYLLLCSDFSKISNTSSKTEIEEFTFSLLKVLKLPQKHVENKERLQDMLKRSQALLDTLQKTSQTLSSVISYDTTLTGNDINKQDS